MNSDPTADFTIHVLDTETGEAAAPPTKGGEMEFHTLGLGRLFRKETEVSADRLLESWQNTSRAIRAMVADAQKDEDATGLSLQELEVKLSVSGKGNIVFVAASAEAGIVLKFKRQ